MDVDTEFRRPAFYALRPGGWRDLVTLLHPPYTAWHLSYVALGAAAASTIHADRLLAALAAFFLGVGVCAHALDELRDRPLGTGLSDRTWSRLPEPAWWERWASALPVSSSSRRPWHRSCSRAGSSSSPTTWSCSAGAFTPTSGSPRLGSLPRFHRLLGQHAVDRYRRHPRHPRVLRAQRGTAAAEHSGASVAAAHAGAHGQADPG